MPAEQQWHVMLILAYLAQSTALYKVQPHKGTVRINCLMLINKALIYLSTKKPLVAASEASFYEQCLISSKDESFLGHL